MSYSHDIIIIIIQTQLLQPPDRQVGPPEGKFTGKRAPDRGLPFPHRRAALRARGAASGRV